MKIFAGTRPLSAMGKLCSLRFLRSELARQSQSTFDAFVRTPCTEWRSQELKRPNLTKDEKDLLTRSPCNQGYRKYALFLTNNCLRLDMALEIFDRRMQGLLDPDTFMWRGTAKMLMGRRDAIVDLEYSLNMFPQNEFAQLIRISYLIRERLQLGECKDKLEKIIGNDSKSQHALLLRAILALGWTHSFRQQIGGFMRKLVRDAACHKPLLGSGTPALDVASSC